MGQAELVEQRTAFSATFRNGSGYQMLFSPQMRHYQDEQGAWQVINPAFRALGDSYVVEQNAIRSRAGRQQAWFSAAAGAAAVLWEPAGLGTVSPGEAYTPLAKPNRALPADAEQTGDGRMLHYRQGWDVPDISEQIASAPGSLEHSMLLAARPFVTGQPAFLELQASLTLLRGSRLWAGGRALSAAEQEETQVTEAFEVRDAQGHPAMTFQPVVAYEQDNPAARVQGEYRLSPTDKPDVWLLGVRTPWQWWAAAERKYPAVIDPVITVQQSTGFANGMAWVRSTGDKAYTLGNIQIGAHLPDYNTQSRGYVQFNSLPALLTNAPIKVKAAYLDVEPDWLWLPTYEYHGKGFTDWDSVPMKRKATLAYIGACPNDPNCNNISIHDNRLANPANFDWDNQPTAVFTYTKQTLTVGPFNDAGNKNPTVTTWEVTSQVQAWYSAWYDKPNPRPGPVFQLYFDQICPKAGPYISGFVKGKPQFDSELVPQCSWYGFSPGKIGLRIEYDELPVSLEGNLFNQPGVPSYAELPGSTDNLFLNPNHHYKLAAPGGAALWRAVALRGNHDYTPGPPTWATLKLLDYTGLANPDAEPVQLVSPKAQGADQTTFFFIDDHLPVGIHNPNTDLRVEVQASPDNAFEQDQARNYRLNYVQATLHPPLNYGVPNLLPMTLSSDRLIGLREFDLVQGDTVGITVTVPISMEVAVVTPASGTTKEAAVISAGHANVNYFGAYNPASSQERALTLSAPVTGRYALAVINKFRPASTLRPGEADPLTAYFSMLVCKEGTYPTKRHKCQPLIIPDGITPLPKSVAIPGGGTLSVYSEGGFHSLGGSDWCTTNEVAGAPVIGPAVGGRWIVVVQGSVCYQGGALSTSPDSAVSLMVATPSINPIDLRQHGQIRPVPIYGENMATPAGGQPGGVVNLGNGGLLQPLAITLRRIQPFGPFGGQKYWQDNYSQATDYITAASMKAYASGQVATQVTVDAAGLPVPKTWSVSWELYPSAACPSCAVEYAFIDDPAIPDAPFPLVIDLASTSLRMLNNDMLDGQVRELASYLSASGPRAFQFHNATSRLTLGALMGGTTKPVQVVIQPPGWPRAAEGAGSCASSGAPTSCLDIRRMEYKWNPTGDAEQNVAPWSLPDIHIQTTPATVAFSRPGSLAIFSADHPAAAQGIAQSFSFDTWNAAVHVAQEKCIDSDPDETTVLRGQAAISLPGIGNDGSGDPAAWIEVVEFRMCQTQLQKAHLSFKTDPPGIIVGSTGFKITLLDGKVVIDPHTGNVKVSLGVGFETLDGFTLMDGKGTVEIDTEGLLSLQASGELVGGQVHANTLRLDVAWNPLDLLFKGEVSYSGDLLTGSVQMHGWVGRGWQGKYSWLPDDDAFHFTGSIKATVRIPQGELIDEKIFKLPPFTISISAQVAFGEFCTNSSCTSYDWGMSATAELLGYDVGVYVDSSGPDLILGTSSHKLIDQAGAAPSAARMFPQAVMAPQPAPPPPVTSYPGTQQANLTLPFTSTLDTVVVEKSKDVCQGTTTSTHICTFTVNPGTGRALFAVSWENGSLDISLQKPGGAVITAANAPAHGVVYTATSDALTNLVAFSVITPTTGLAIDHGTWSLRLGGVMPPNPAQGNILNNYHITFAADPPAATLDWQAPVLLSPTLARLPWTPSRGGQSLSPDLDAELFFIPAAQKPVTPTLMAGTLIAAKVSTLGGLYDWDLRPLAAGVYAYGIRLDDRATGNGHVVIWSPYTITYADSTPPPEPVVVGTNADTDSLYVHWLRDTSTLDLAGYLVEYTVPDWDLTAPLPAARRVLPTLKNPQKLFDIFEHIRLGGLVLSQPGKQIQSMVCVRAYDASGNISTCTPIDVTMPEVPQPRARRPAGIHLSTNGAAILATWDPPDTRDAGGYLLGYSPASCRLPRANRTAGEGATPLQFGPADNAATLSDLTPGQVYEVGVRTVSASGDISPGVFERILLIDPTDGNADGLPDQWAALYGVSDPSADTDGDGLLDIDEYLMATDPRAADSDGDGAYDGVEAEAGKDPCNPADQPQGETPRLALTGDAVMRFAAATNLNPAEPQFLEITNPGGGTLTWSARASAAWIVLDKTGGSAPDHLTVQVDPAGLAAGVYTGSITITSLAGRMTQPQAALPEQKAIDVQLVVLPAKLLTIYLPVISR